MKFLPLKFLHKEHSSLCALNNCEKFPPCKVGLGQFVKKFP